MRSEIDKLLLTAALAPPIKANAAWNKWKSAVEPQDAPHVLSWAGGYIYLNLKNLGIEDPYLRGIFRHNFLANNYRLSQVKATVNKLASNWEISPIKSFGMSVADNSLGLRPIADFDFYLEGSRAIEVFEYLQSQGYKSNLGIEIFEFKARHFKRRGSWNFVNSAGFDLDLHWRLFDHLSIKDNQALLEGNSRISETKHGKFRMLSPDLMSVLIINHHLLGASTHYSGLFDIARLIAQSNLRIVGQLASRIGISREMREVLQVIDEHSESSHESELGIYSHNTDLPAKTLLIEKSTDYELMRHCAIYKAWYKSHKPLWIEKFVTKYCGGFVNSDVAKLNLFQGARLGSGWHYQYPLDKHRWLNIGDSRFTLLHSRTGDHELVVSFDTYLFSLLSHIECLKVFANGKQIGVIEKSNSSSIFKYSVDKAGKIEFSIRSEGQSTKEVAGFDFNWRLLSLPLLSIETRPLNRDLALLTAFRRTQFPSGSIPAQATKFLIKVKGLQMQQSVIALIKKYGSMWRWALVGISTTVIDYLIFISMYSIITSVLVANFCAGLFSITFNYLAHYFWSFKSQADHSKSGVKYLLNLVIFWSAGTLLLKGLITAGIDPRIAKLIPIPFIAPLSFLSLKFFVFKKKIL